MAGVWRMLSASGILAVVACVARGQPSYEEMVTQDLGFFNKGQRGQPLFSLLEAIPDLVCWVSLGPPRLEKQVTPAL